MRDLHFSVDDSLTIRAANTSASPCRVAGEPPVAMLVGRVDPPYPATLVAVLQPGDVFVQPQTVQPDRSACTRPISGGIIGEGLFTITIDGGPTTTIPVGPRVGIIPIVNCTVVVRPQGHVEHH